MTAGTAVRGRRLLGRALVLGLVGAGAAGALLAARPDLARRAAQVVLARVPAAPSDGAPAPPPAAPPQRPPDRRPDGTPWESGPVGTNLMGPFFWGTNLPFVDLMRASGSMGSQPGELALDTDAHGWPTRLRPGQTAMIGVMLNMPPGGYPKGRYTILYEGRGRVHSFLEGRLLPDASAPGREYLAIDEANGAGILLGIVESDPEDPIRDVRVLLPGGVCRGDALRSCRSAADCDGGARCEPFEETYATQLFNPEFLSRLRGYSVLRFMDWMDTNGSKQRTWKDRPTLEDRSWMSGEEHARGVPVEVLVALANRLGAHPWFNLPHGADDDYVRRFAALVAERLDPKLRAWVEYSNEVWNGGFPQHGYATEQGTARGLAGDPYLASARFYSERSVEVFRIFEEAFGGRDRLVRVMATQSVNTYLSQVLLSWKDAYQHADVLATAPYFSVPIDDAEQAQRIEREGIDGLLARLESEGVPEAVRQVGAQQEVAEAYGLRLVAYEGGQHLVGAWPVRDRDELNAVLDGVQRRLEMKRLYLSYLEGWKGAGGTLFVHFSDCVGFSKHGRWGALERVGQPRQEAPKYDGLRSFSETHSPWW